MITTMLDDSIPLTVNEWDEWGDPRVREHFDAMLAYSPYDNPPPAGSRPDLLVTGAVHDTRVLVHEPAKWVALLRETDPGVGATVPVPRRDRHRLPRRPERPPRPPGVRGGRGDLAPGPARRHFLIVSFTVVAALVPTEFLAVTMTL